MEQYISKSALVAEIEKLKGKVSDSSSYCNGWQHALRMLELSLDTLEVKEAYMDLTSGIDDILEKNGINPNTTGAKIIKEAFYKATDKRLT